MTGCLHICAPPVESFFIRRGTCPDCKRASFFLGRTYEWYGSNQTCLRCGREWADGEWVPLPFMRGAREKNISHAKNLWRKHHPKTTTAEEAEP